MRVLYAQGFEGLEEPSLIALAQIILHILDVSFKEPFVDTVTDSVNARIISPDSSLQLNVLSVDPLPLPGCSSRGRRHADLRFCLGVSPPSPPREPGRSRRRNPFFCLQYGCRKRILHNINTAVARGKCPEVVSDHCRYFLVPIGVIRERHDGRGCPTPPSSLLTQVPRACLSCSFAHYAIPRRPVF